MSAYVDDIRAWALCRSISWHLQRLSWTGNPLRVDLYYDSASDLQNVGRECWDLALAFFLFYFPVSAIYCTILWERGAHISVVPFLAEQSNSAAISQGSVATQWR